MTESDYWTIKAMEQYGGSFVKGLAEAANHATDHNLELIKKTWPKFWEEYERIGTDMKKHKEQ